MAHAQDLGDGSHRQAVLVGGADRLIPLLAQLVAGLVQRRLALGVLLGKGSQMSSGVGCLAFGSGDPRIV
jgi:hypothetical protein